MFGRTAVVAVIAVASASLAACSASTSSSIVERSAGAVADTKIVVGLGDSYMSGEAGRWATNGVNNGTELNGYPSGTGHQVAAKPADAYPKGTDSKSGGPRQGCHASVSAPMVIGNGWEAVNLACSGARTASFQDSDGNWKPGIDFAKGRTADQVGQATALEDYAKKHSDIGAIVISIGGNDMGFSAVLQRCVSEYAKPSVLSNDCAKVKENKEVFTDANRASLETKIAGALANVAKAMKSAGYADNSYRIVYQLPPSIVPTPDLVREKNSGYNRQNKCGLPMSDPDLKWADETVVPFLRNTLLGGIGKFRAAHDGGPPVTAVDVTDLFVGHRVCEKGAEQAGDSKPDSGYKAPDWATLGKHTEWVRRINLTEQLSPAGVPVDALSEPMHPMYWGQRALAACNYKGVTSPPNTKIVKCVLDGGGLDPNDSTYPKVKVS